MVCRFICRSIWPLRSVGLSVDRSCMRMFSKTAYDVTEKYHLSVPNIFLIGGLFPKWRSFAVLKNAIEQRLLVTQLQGKLKKETKPTFF